MYWLQSLWLSLVFKNTLELFVENDIQFFRLADKADILHFTNNALSKVLSGYTTRSGPKTLW